MFYLSGCYRQQSKNAASLLLQQCRCGHAHMLFACVCSGKGEDAEKAGDYMTERLWQWFRGLDGKKPTRNLGRGMRRLAKSLEETVRRIDLEWSKLQNSERVDFSGVFCLEDNYLLIHRGQTRIYLMNTAFGRGHARRLDGEKGRRELEMEQGILQQDVGLLFATESFFDWVTDKILAEGLFVGETPTEEQMERHLKELAGEGERKGSLGVGAIFVRTVGGGR